MTDFNNLCMHCMADRLGESVCPICGSSTNDKQMRGALPYKTVLQKRYIVGAAKKSNGEGITYIGYDTIQKAPVKLREFFPQTICERRADGVSVRIIDGSEIIFDECLSRFLSYSRKIAHMRELSAIEHIYDIFEENNTAYTVVEWNKSISLQYFVERSGGHISWNDARQLFMPVLSALSALHEKGINHLGISPESLVILEDGKMILTDFCIETVRRMDDDLPPDLAPGCAAIEQYVMDYKPDETTDVYGFAACIFFALAGFLPDDAVKRRDNARLLLPSSLVRTIPPHVIRALANALQVSPDKRTQTFERLREEISAAPTVTAQIDTPEIVRHLPAVEQPRKGSEESKKGFPPIAWAVISFFSVVVVFLIIGLIWFLVSQPTLPEEDPSTSSALVASQVSNSSGISSSEGISSTAVLDENHIQVPNLVGQSYEELMESPNPDYEILLSDKQFSDEIGEGLIISQTPEVSENAVMEKGSAVVVVVSLGKSQRELPAIAGLTLAEASERLTEAGFTPTKVDVYSDSVPSGTVIGYQGQSEGDLLPYGAHVVIQLSQGAQP